MHYKNRRPARVGDAVIGISHNSGARLVLAVVAEIIEGQGPCNLRLLRFHRMVKHRAPNYEESAVPIYFGKERTYGGIEYREDFGDAKEFIHIEDGYRMVRAVVDFGDINAPYYPVKLELGTGVS